MRIDRFFGFGKRDLLVPYFNFSIALKNSISTSALKEIFQLRYAVYCIECQFLAPEEFKDGLEMDEYDTCSTHFSAYSMDNIIVGAVRLVQPDSHLSYPFENHCSVFENYVMPPRDRSAEISRLVVRKSYRRRRGDSMQGISKDFTERGSPQSIQPHGRINRRDGNSPLLLLGLYREMYRYSKKNGIRYWYAAMERSLARSLDKMGFRFVPIGPQTDYYGPVSPYIVDLEELNERLHLENKFLAAWFNDEPMPFLIVVRAFLGLGFRKFIKKRQ